MPLIAPLFAFGDGVIDAFKPTTWRHAFTPPERRVWHTRVLGMSGIGAILPLPPRARRGLETAQLRMYAAAICYVRIPRQSGQGFRFDVGHRSDLIPATIPK
jgi:hypothetical protein